LARVSAERDISFSATAVAWVSAGRNIIFSATAVARVSAQRERERGRES